MKLYNYFRSSASYRVRIALALKGLTYDYVPVALTRDEQSLPTYKALAPSGLVPLLEDDGQHFSQSMAIIEYLEETHPLPPLLPGDAARRARIRALAQDVACDIHPLNNLRVLRYLVRDLGLSEEDKERWVRHWIVLGLGVIEARLREGDRFSDGDDVTLVDVMLVPQLFNAQRFGCDLAPFPKVRAVYEACMQLPAFHGTQPSLCPDAV